MPITKRISGTPAQDATKRVAATFLTNRLLLEGDQSGYLFLEGDAVTDEHDKLLLEGDQFDADTHATPRVSAGAITSRMTKRLG